MKLYSPQKDSPPILGFYTIRRTLERFFNSRRQVGKWLPHTVVQVAYCK